MHKKDLSIPLVLVLAVMAFSALATRSAAQTETLLYSFGGNAKDAVQPFSSLIFDKAGNLYGATYSGGIHGQGTVFELMPKAGGGYIEKVLHNFINNGVDGRGPWGNLIFDKNGNLYGTTMSGGADDVGTVFELLPQKGGTWTETILHSFSNNGTDGQGATTGVILDAKGNIYGTTEAGGTGSNCGGGACGVAFELVRQPGGSYTEKILHNFNNNQTDGANPSGLVFDPSGNVYGTTANGGTEFFDCGVVFELSPASSGQWTETLLHTFTCTDGQYPVASLIFDPSGNLFGTTQYGGAYEKGTVFELTPAGDGTWTELDLHDFNPNGIDGTRPDFGTLGRDAAGNLYGTTLQGGSDGYGTVFELSNIGGTWVETMLYSLTDANGDYPATSVILDTHGNLYGTTTYGGVHGEGVVFEVAP